MADLQVADLSLVDDFSAEPARSLRRSASVRAAPKAPTCRKPRRDVPSQNLSIAPQTVNMLPSSCDWNNGDASTTPHPIPTPTAMQPGTAWLSHFSARAKKGSSPP